MKIFLDYLSDLFILGLDFMLDCAIFVFLGNEFVRTDAFWRKQLF